MSELNSLTDLKDMLSSLVKISDFAKSTSKILEELNRKNKEVVIMKNNDPQGVILPMTRFNEVAEHLKEYESLQKEVIRLREEIENLSLLLTAEERMSHYNTNETLSRQEIFTKYGIDQDKINTLAETVEIE